MEAFLNDPKVKEKYLARVEAHQKADEIVKGIYWEGGKGCAVGCTVHGSLHKDYETELGIPEWLARLEDRLFEGMPLERSKKWPKEFLDAINVGADLNKIKIPFLIVVAESGLDKFDHKKFPKVKAAIDGVVKELKRKVINKEKLMAARNAADADAADAADAAYAAYAAYAAAYAADAAYADAAAAYADAAYADAAADAADAAYAAARSKQYEYFADKLLELLKDCR